MTATAAAPITDHLRTGQGRPWTARRRPAGDDRVAPLSAGRARRPAQLRGHRAAFAPSRLPVPVAARVATPTRSTSSSAR